MDGVTDAEREMEDVVDADSVGDSVVVGVGLMVDSGDRDVVSDRDTLC